MLVDTLGLIWALVVLPADVSDPAGAKTLLQRRPSMPRLAVIWADKAYSGLIDWIWTTVGCLLSVVLRPAEARGFVHLPHRWIVERTFGWLGRYRRLSKDYEHNLQSSEAWIRVAMIHRMARAYFPARDPDGRLRLLKTARKRARKKRRKQPN